MSRRHHGRSRNGRGRDDSARLTGPLEPRADVNDRSANVAAHDSPAPAVPPAVEPVRLPAPVAATVPTPSVATPEPRTNGAAPTNGRPAWNGAPLVNGHEGHGDGGRAGCTAPQLRRFIKSRPYVPMHELRRRFGINGAEDDVTPLALDDGRVYVGLPERECRLLSELVRGGEVGYELSLDPRTPIVVGVYPMRPVPRA